MEFCDKSWNFINIAPDFDQICTFFVDVEKFGISFENQDYLTFSAKCFECKIWAERWSWKIEKPSWKSHRKTFCKVSGNPDTRGPTYFTLPSVLIFP